jgi:ATP-binding cassette subfamily F protein uup
VSAGTPAKAKAGSAEERAARKNVARIDKQLSRIAEEESALNAEILEHAQDYERLAALSARLDVLAAEKDELEMEWLEAAEILE